MGEIKGVLIASWFTMALEMIKAMTTAPIAYKKMKRSRSEAGDGLFQIAQE